MTRIHRSVVALLAMGLCLPVPARAQVRPTPGVPATPAAPPALPSADTQPSRPRQGPRTTLDVQVVIVRTQGGKVLSRLPHLLAVTTHAEPSQLNMGAEVPVPSSTFMPGRPPAPRPAGVTPPAGPGAAAAPESATEPPVPGPPVQSVTYRNVGTAIVCRGLTTEDAGVYELVLSVDDSSVLPRDSAGAATAGPGLPAFRSFRTRNTLLLRDGQTRAFTAAADRVSGEEVQVEVTMKVVR